MARHRTSRRGGVVSRVEAADIVAVLQRLFALHGARWQGRGEEGVLADGAVRAFHLAAAPLLAEAGLLRLYAVTIEGQIVGIYHGLHHRECAYAYLGGFDPAFGFESPGAVLLGHALEEAIGEGAREFHLLRGQEPYKYEWGAVDRWNERLTFRRQA
jgi:CelD/BcsL family acetyltransferase involved in cellulose biosynthesis